MKHVLGIITIIVAIHTAVFSANYQMLTDLGSSAEMIGIGNIEGFTQSANNIFENPAGLYRVHTISATAFTTTIMEEVQYTNASMAFNSGFGVFGVGYMAAGVEDIPFTIVNDSNVFEQFGSFEYQNSVIKAGYAASLSDDLHVGGSLVMYQNKIYTITGTGYNLDLGMIYQISDLSLSLHGRNLIPMKVSYVDSEDSDYSGEEDLPLQAVFGLHYPFGDFAVLGQIKFDGVNSLISTGGSYTPGFLGHMLSLSAGYKEYSVLEEVENTQSFGVGLDLFGFRMDYAYEILQKNAQFDSTNFFSLSFNL